MWMERRCLRPGGRSAVQNTNPGLAALYAGGGFAVRFDPHGHQRRLAAFGEAFRDGQRAVAPRVAAGAFADRIDMGVGDMVRAPPAGSVVVGGPDRLLQRLLRGFRPRP